MVAHLQPWNGVGLVRRAVLSPQFGCILRMLPVFGAVRVHVWLSLVSPAQVHGTKWLHRGTFRLGSCSQLCLPLQFGAVCGLVQYSPVLLRQPSGDGGSAPIKIFLRTAT